MRPVIALGIPAAGLVPALRALAQPTVIYPLHAFGWRGLYPCHEGHLSVEVKGNLIFFSPHLDVDRPHVGGDEAGLIVGDGAVTHDFNVEAIEAQIVARGKRTQLKVFGVVPRVANDAMPPAVNPLRRQMAHQYRGPAGTQREKARRGEEYCANQNEQH